MKHRIAGMPNNRNHSIESVPLSKLEPHPENARRGNVKAIRESIRENGWWGAVLVQRSTRRIIAGNHRYQAAVAEGLDKIPAIFVDCDDDEARRIMLADNRTTDLATYDDQALADLLRETSANDRGLLGTGWTDRDLDKLIADTAPAASSSGEPGAVDLTPEAPKIATTKPGDVWKLGSHVLACVDSTIVANLDQLLEPRAAAVVADPPYAMWGSSTGFHADITDDKMIRPFFRQVIAACVRAVPAYGHVYLCCDWRSWSAWWEAAKGSALLPKNMIVWAKSGGLGTMYTNAHELILFGTVQITREQMSTRKKAAHERTIRSSTNVWEIPRVTNHPSERRRHNAQKPVALFAKAIEHSTDPGDLVFDPFVGSGTSLIACETTERRSISIDIEPIWCDVAIERWQEFSGGKARRIRKGSK